LEKREAELLKRLEKDPDDEGALAEIVGVYVAKENYESALKYQKKLDEDFWTDEQQDAGLIEFFKDNKQMYDELFTEKYYSYSDSFLLFKMTIQEEGKHQGKP
jgi:hypothetical protein